jgi:hypothetical protein
MTLLGAYVLGALDDEERDRVDAHIEGCVACREELESLFAVRAQLARLSEADVVALDPAPAPPALRTRVLAAVRAQRRRVVRRRLAAAVVLTAVVAAAVALALPAAEHGGQARAVTATDAATGVRAAVAARPKAWGTELTLRLSGATPGERCRLIARARDGRHAVAATWWATYRGTAEVTGAAALPAEDLVALDVVTAAGRRLIHIPIDGGGAS